MLKRLRLGYVCCTAAIMQCKRERQSIEDEEQEPIQSSQHDQQVLCCVRLPASLFSSSHAKCTGQVRVSTSEYNTVLH